MSTPARPEGKNPPRPKGRLEWHELLHWLRDDGLITEADAERVVQRFGAGASSLHALVRLGGAGLKRATGAALDTEALTEWLATRAGLPYVRIDPLKADVGRVADVMSVRYAETRCALPLSFGSAEVTVATGEPFDVGWLPEIEAHTRRSVRLVLANPLDVRRYTTEFYALAKSVRSASKNGETATAASFEQLVELGKTNKQLDANDQGVVQVVDWLWQYA
ncbi:MAG: type II/IV secretion system protein, partial [Rubrivivax sp.]|nr:type II/IV secretion system protein [Rubrivivax sp.]